MRDMAAQLRRGFKSTGFWMAVLLQLFALFYVHMDAGLFWQDPLEYFRCGDFYYTFFISTELGLHWLTLPMIAILPMGYVFADDRQSGYDQLLLYRQSRLGYVAHRAVAACLTACVAVLVAFCLYIAFIALATPWTNGGTGWQELAQNGAYGWRATNEFFYVLVLECTGRLMLSTILWVLVGLAMSQLWQNRVFVTVMVIAINLFLESYIPARFGTNLSLSYLQIPPCTAEQTLALSLAKQLIYLGCAMLAFCITAYARFSARLHRCIARFKQAKPFCPWVHSFPQPLRAFGGATCTGRFLAELRSCCNLQTLSLSVVVGGFAVFLTTTCQLARFSAGDVLLECYGGLEWATPVVNFPNIARWALLLLPPMMGIALNVNRELGQRALITINRYGSQSKWWAYKSMALFVYTIICVSVMFLATTVMAYLMGANGFSLFEEDADGFMVQSSVMIFKALILFTCHIMMLVQLQIFAHSVSNDMRIGLLIYLVPVVISLVAASNADHIVNEWIPYSWGMLRRTSLYASNGYSIALGDGTSEWLAQCSLLYENVVVYQLISAFVFGLFTYVMMRIAKITSRKAKL